MADNSPNAKKNIDRLKALLLEMFQLDRGDLDFGLYRIMNMKSAEVTAFLDKDLLPQVKESLNLASEEDIAWLESEMERAVKAARELRVNPEEAPQIQELKARLREMRKDLAAEADVYNHLSNFFARYYAEGDFLSQRRYASGGRSSYLIPYDGEEVKLHWANADSYYIKTTENYASYAFTVGSAAQRRGARFEMAAADNEKDNNKEANGKQRRFLLAKNDGAVAVKDGVLVAQFEHRPLTQDEKKAWQGNGNKQQGQINEKTAERILNAVDAEWRALLTAPEPTDANGERILLAKHIERYTAKNSFDYFIHKDLKGFLRLELDLYLNTEVLNLDDLEQGDALRLDRALARVRAIRHVGGKIIDFLAQLEDFQKQLWLKKKFVLETNWCATLDRVPEKFYLEISANRAQCEEWEKLFAVDEIVGDLGNGNQTWNIPPPVDFLKSNPHLVLDTRHFSRDFVDKLLAALSAARPLDEQTDGTLIHSENFQALNLLQTRYREQVQCVYIDPPYNTDASAILYKNGYKDSSWLSLMEDRLSTSKSFLKQDGVICCAIDDEEAWRLLDLLHAIFERELGTIPVRTNPAGRKSTGQFSPCHEYALFFGAKDAEPGSLLKTEKESERYPFVDDEGRYAWNNLIRHGSGDKREDVPTMFYPIYVKDDDAIRIPKMEWNEEKREYRILEKPKSDEVAIWPVRGTSQKRWHRGWERVQSEPSEYRIRRDKDNGGINIDFRIRMDEKAPPKTWWDKSEYASANHGAKALKELFGDKPFDFSKSIHLVEDCLRASGGNEENAVIADYFAGSGTTGHAVINLNREDDGERKYILVEMGQYFDTILLPRLKKAVYSKDWKDGKPVSREGNGQLIKYIRLESYEDTMDSLELKQLDDDALAGNAKLAEDYRLRYALGAETAGSACLLGKTFTNPFAYTLSVVRDGVRREVPVDLPETFNYLLGLRVKSRQLIDGALVIAGADAEGQSCLIIWRNVEEMDDSALDKWFARHRQQFSESLEAIYANGDHTLNAMRQNKETWVAKTIEPVFHELMFEKSLQ